MFRDTITIFNRKRGMGFSGDIWYPTVLRDVDLQASEAATAAKYGYHRGDKALVLVHYTGPPEEPVVGGKPYMPPQMWQAAEDPAAAVTFQTGERGDFFVEGAWPGPGPINDGDYPQGVYHHVNKTRDGVWAVTDAEKYTIIPHFEVTGK